MKKRFVAKKTFRLAFLKTVVLVIITIISFWIAISALFKVLVKDIGEMEYARISFLNTGVSKTKLFDINLLSPKYILVLGINTFKKKEEKKVIENPVLSDQNIIDDKQDTSNEPIVYIYNTHDTESYDKSVLSAANISHTVGAASIMLRDYLNDLGIPSYVESSSMSEYLKTNNLSYASSYRASRYYIDKRKKEMDSLEYFIDIHRDSVGKSATTVEIDGKAYAKILFVVGLEHDNYEKNLEFVNKLKGHIDKRLIRGISKKSGASVNGIYNQDTSPNAILIEVGGVDNTIIEVDNTMKVFAKALFEYEEEENGREKKET